MFSGNNCMSVPVVASLGGNSNNGSNGDGMFGGGVWSWLIIVLFLFVFLGWGNNWGGNNGNNNGGGGNTMPTYIPIPTGISSSSSYTDSSVQRGFDQQAIISKLDGINNGICSLGYDQLNQMNGINQNVSQTGFGIQNALCQGFSGVNAAIAQNGYQNQQCCCDTQKEIIQNRYEASQNTCAITNAIHNEAEQTRALINANTMQDLRDKLAEKDRDVLARDFQLSQLSQNETLINRLSPCPIPAYPACPTNAYAPFGFAAFNSGNCGCNSGCGCA